MSWDQRVDKLLESLQPVNEKDISDLITKFSNILCLHHWGIKYRLEDQKKMGDSLMKVLPHRDRNLATIYIQKDLIGKPLNVFGPLLLHELIHLVLDPLVDEHTLQLRFEVSNTRLLEYQTRFKRPLEQIVEHLTTQIALLIDISTTALDFDRLYEQNTYNHELLLEVYEVLAKKKHHTLKEGDN